MIAVWCPVDDIHNFTSFHVVICWAVWKLALIGQRTFMCHSNVSKRSWIIAHNLLLAYSHNYTSYSVWVWMYSWKHIKLLTHLLCVLNQKRLIDIYRVLINKTIKSTVSNATLQTSRKYKTPNFISTRLIINIILYAVSDIIGLIKKIYIQS